MEGISIPSNIKADIKEFLRIDDGLKDARLQMKESRGSMNECREHIIDFMKKSDVFELEVGKGAQKLMLQEKELKIRADAEVIKAKLQEMLSQGITDTEKIWEEINKCGGTKTVWKLARRSKRKQQPKDSARAKKQRIED